MANEDGVAVTHTAGIADTLQAGGSSSPDGSSADAMRSSPGSGRHSIELAEGTLLDGAYKVIKRIGGGAMGTVYLVEHQQLGRRFAAKVVASAHSADLEIIARLRNEARVASSIQHENIVDVTHLGRTAEGALFIVMELLQGCDLRHRLGEHETNTAAPWLPDEQSRRIARDVLTGLQAAHDAGIVHRDLKPDNIFLSNKGGTERAKLVDFGISKGARGDASDMRLTRTGQIIGTPLYMAPEQARGSENVDHRADLYAIGVILYELTTGRLPFEATSIYDLIVKHATETPPPPRTRRASLPEAVELVIMRCLEKSPDDRYPSAKETLDAWENAWAGIGPTTLPPSMRPVTATGPSPEPAARGPARVIAGAVVVVTLLVVGGLSLRGMNVTTTIAAPLTTAVPPTSIAIETPIATAPPTTVEAPPLDVQRTIASDPTGATVEVAGVTLGTTPVALVLAGGAPTEILVHAPGRRSVTRTISASDSDTVTIALERTSGHAHPPASGLPMLAPH
jgi:serine/threonine protein kinase